MTKRAAKFRTKITFDKIGSNLTDKSMQQTMRNAVIIAKNSINNSNNAGIKYYGLKNNSSLHPDPPANQSGALVSSIRGSRIPSRKTIRGFTIESDQPYSAALEFGYSPRNLKSRPFIRPAVQKAMKNYIRQELKTEYLIRNKVGKIIKRSST